MTWFLKQITVVKKKKEENRRKEWLAEENRDLKDLTSCHNVTSDSNKLNVKKRLIKIREMYMWTRYR